MIYSLVENDFKFQLQTETHQMILFDRIIVEMPDKDRDKSELLAGAKENGLCMIENVRKLLGVVSCDCSRQSVATMIF
jgi:hypothetical protein